MARRARKTRYRWLAALAIVGIAVLAATIYFIHLDRLVTHQFEGRRWTLPAQVYAAPLELYAGLALPADAIERELQRLEYRSVSKLDRPGTYHRQGSRLDVALRAARFADEVRPALTVRICATVTGARCRSRVSSRC